MTKEDFIADYKKFLDWRWQQEFEDIIDSTWEARDAEIEELEAALKGCRKKITEQAKEILSLLQEIKELETDAKYVTDDQYQ